MKKLLHEIVRRTRGRDTEGILWMMEALTGLNVKWETIEAANDEEKRAAA